jgi:hypothetical protein
MIMEKYVQEIKWTIKPGHTKSISVEGNEGQSLESVQAMAAAYAKQWGWTPPKWWQWWRWNDTRLPNKASTR